MFVIFVIFAVFFHDTKKKKFPEKIPAKIFSAKIYSTGEIK